MAAAFEKAKRTPLPGRRPPAVQKASLPSGNSGSSAQSRRQSPSAEKKEAVAAARILMRMREDPFKVSDMSQSEEFHHSRKPSDVPLLKAHQSESSNKCSLRIMPRNSPPG